MASRCVRKQVTLVTAPARPPDTFVCSQPAHQAGLGAVTSFCASLRRAGVSRGSSVCPPQHQSKQDKGQKCLELTLLQHKLSKGGFASLTACRLLDCQQPLTAASELLVQQQFLLPLLLQELCTTLKLVVLCFSPVPSLLPPRLGTEGRQACTHGLVLLTLLNETLCSALRLSGAIKLQNNHPDNTER